MPPQRLLLDRIDERERAEGPAAEGATAPETLRHPDRPWTKDSGKRSSSSRRRFKCESAPKVDLFQKKSKYLILLGKSSRRRGIIGADRDTTQSPI